MFSCFLRFVLFNSTKTVSILSKKCYFMCVLACLQFTVTDNYPFHLLKFIYNYLNTLTLRLHVRIVQLHFKVCKLQTWILKKPNEWNKILCSTFTSCTWRANKLHFYTFTFLNKGQKYIKWCNPSARGALYQQHYLVPPNDQTIFVPFYQQIN